VLKNLIGNAVKFTPEGSVIIAAQALGGGVEIRVTDTGVGIPPDALSLIFEPFRQVDSSMSRQYGGTGLGLYIRPVANLSWREQRMRS
jgi:signal transduction histidine kinase